MFSCKQNVVVAFMPIAQITNTAADFPAYSEQYRCIYICIIRESVDSLCRDGANAQYMQYLSKCRITSPQIR